MSQRLGEGISGACKHYVTKPGYCRVYHKAMNAADFTKIETKLAWLRMTNLKPSSQHVLYVEAVGERATSLPSETLVAWTDPALPAFVDVICLIVT